LQSTLENMGEGLSVFDRDGRLVAWNHWLSQPKPSRRNRRPFSATLPESVRGYL
jgi:hypothetical protein